MLGKHPRFEKEKAPAILRRFCPDYHVRTISDIDPVDLVAGGIRGVLLDLDNTLLPWKGSELPEETVAWIEACRAAGLMMCLVSNTRNVPRLCTIGERLLVEVVMPGRMKPAREGFQRALAHLNLAPSEVVMVGDQMFTDIWGGNRMGLCTIWVDRIHHREFFGTKISRFFERLIMGILRRSERKQAR
ncbi:MAG: YqeG family HAD IIIA-type phosphatase [Armatimonadetes bacterium]|nr:YqeG family HAD IIIA-type phosphatase [Armatimonadota bacterium]